MDGAYAAVKFPTKEIGQDHAGPSKEDPSSLLQDCRLLRNDELTVREILSFCKHTIKKFVKFSNFVVTKFSLLKCA